VGHTPESTPKINSQKSIDFFYMVDVHLYLFFFFISLEPRVK